MLIAAGDTFRAAAIEQLEIWAERVGAGLFAKAQGSDPAAVAFDAVERPWPRATTSCYLDTAGRLHTKTNLMEELKKIERVLGKKHPGRPAPHHSRAGRHHGPERPSQAKLFNEAVGVDEIVLTKLDGTAKGGVVVGIALEHAIPITFVGWARRWKTCGRFRARILLKHCLCKS